MKCNVLGPNGWVRSHSRRIQCQTNSAVTIQTILCVFISIQLTFWKHYSHFGGCETPLDLCWCQTNRANLPCKEIQIRQKAFNNVLHYGGKGLVYHCFVVFHNWLMARLPNTLQVATELTERCFVEHKIVSVLKSHFLLGMLYDALLFALWLQPSSFKPQTSYNTCSTR